MNNEKKQLSIGIAGCGQVVTFFILRAIRKAEGIKLTSLCDINQKRLVKAGKYHSSIKKYVDYNKFINDPDIDAVYIATPPKYHHEMIIKAIKAGKHVICEKPLVLNNEEILDIKKHLTPGIIIMPAHNYTYSPCLDWAVDAINDSIIGTVTKVKNIFDINVNLWNNVTKYHTDSVHGGVLYDHFPHVVYTASRFAGKMNHIQNVVLERDDNDVCEKVIVNGKSEEGIESEIQASWRHPFFNWKMQIFGTKGTICLDPQKSPLSMLIRDTKGKVFMKRKDKSFLSQIISNHFTYKLELEDFAKAVLNGKDPKASFADSIETIRMIDTVKDWEKKRSITK